MFNKKRSLIYVLLVLVIISIPKVSFAATPIRMMDLNNFGSSVQILVEIRELINVFASKVVAWENKEINTIDFFFAMSDIESEATALMDRASALTTQTKDPHSHILASTKNILIASCLALLEATDAANNRWLTEVEKEELLWRRVAQLDIQVVLLNMTIAQMYLEAYSQLYE